MQTNHSDVVGQILVEHRAVRSVVCERGLIVQVCKYAEVENFGNVHPSHPTRPHIYISSMLFGTVDGAHTSSCSVLEEKRQTQHVPFT